MHSSWTYITHNATQLLTAANVSSIRSEKEQITEVW